MHNDGMMVLSSSAHDQGKDLEKKFLSFHQDQTLVSEHEREKNKNYDKFQILNQQRGCK